MSCKKGFTRLLVFEIATQKRLIINCYFFISSANCPNRLNAAKVKGYGDKGAHRAHPSYYGYYTIQNGLINGRYFIYKTDFANSEPGI